MVQKSTHWMVHYPGEVYANDIWFESPMDEQEVRQNEREIIHVNRLPNEMEFWIP